MGIGHDRGIWWGYTAGRFQGKTPGGGKVDLKEARSIAWTFRRKAERSDRKMSPCAGAAKFQVWAAIYKLHWVAPHPWHGRRSYQTLGVGSRYPSDSGHFGWLTVGPEQVLRGSGSTTSCLTISKCFVQKKGCQKIQWSSSHHHLVILDHFWDTLTFLDKATGDHGGCQTKELCRIYSAPRPWLVMMSTIGLGKLKQGWWDVLG